MIFRRIAQHVKEQNWTAVAIDFGIVVVGVFLGIQIGNWNAERQERELGTSYLQRIAGDLRTDAEVFETRLQSWQDEERDLESMLVYVEKGDLDERTPWEMAQLAYYRAGWGVFAPDKTAYEELRSTGQIRLIADADLRRSISDYYARIAESDPFYTYETPLREMIRSKYPPALQRYFWVTCYSENVYRSSGDGRTGCPPFGGASEIADALSALRTDPDLAEAIRYGISIRLIVLNIARRDLVRNQELIAQLEAQLR
ncbi:hypothetical protein [Rubrivirga sp. IMCC45206]|uniref:hypothetical protein n=1 Tax=Rubrivirga sp. IMCC45206 TaxID=3391614 RepID=UPI00398F9961